MVKEKIHVGSKIKVIDKKSLYFGMDGTVCQILIQPSLLSDDCEMATCICNLPKSKRNLVEFELSQVEAIND